MRCGSNFHLVLFLRQVWEARFEDTFSKGTSRLRRNHDLYLYLASFDMIKPLHTYKLKSCGYWFCSFAGFPRKSLLFLTIDIMFGCCMRSEAKWLVVKFSFKRSGQTIHTYFHNVLRAVLKLHEVLLAKPSPVTDDCTHLSWKHFKGCLGALDGTLIDVTVPETDKARYRTRKGTVSVNVLAACDRGMCFMYMLAGWEGSAADARVLRDAITRNDGLRVPRDKKQQYYDTKVPKM
ncbi:hypothetical protein ACS0TY_008182 [Phlomoides rotata]